jgi:hypothetical protein
VVERVARVDQIDAGRLDVLGQALARRRDQRLGIVDREARAQFRVRVGERVHTGHVEPSDLVRVAERAQRTTAQVERARRTAPLLAFGQHVDQTVDPDRVLVAPDRRNEAILGVFAVKTLVVRNEQFHVDGPDGVRVDGDVHVGRSAEADAVDAVVVGLDREPRGAGRRNVQVDDQLVATQAVQEREPRARAVVANADRSGARGVGDRHLRGRRLENDAVLAAREVDAGRSAGRAAEHGHRGGAAEAEPPHRSTPTRSSRNA